MTTTNSDDGRTEKELALWMLERMRESSTLLAAVRAARIDGYRHRSIRLR